MVGTLEFLDILLLHFWGNSLEYVKMSGILG